MAQDGRMTVQSVAVAGVVLMSVATVLYTYEEGFMSFVTPSLAGVFARMAYAYIAALLVGGAMVVWATRRFVVGRITEMNGKGVAPLSPSWIIPYLLSQSRFRRYFWAATITYGLFYSFVTSIIVYQPTVDFVQAYRATFPSVLIGPCCGPPLYTPIVTIYLVNHLGLLMIPLTVILLFVVSVLVGLNFALAAFAFSNRAGSPGKSWLGGLGAAVGLFTGCPTCAGLFFADFIGGAGAVSFAGVLSYYQPLFIALSVPVLLGTPLLISKSLSRVMKDGCVAVRAEPKPPA